MSKNNKIYRDFVFLSIVIVYTLIMCKILFFKIVSPIELLSPDRETLRSLSLIPLDSIHRYMNGTKFLNNIAILNVIGNVLIFIPLGTFIMLYRKEKKALKTVLNIFVSSVLVEVIQFIFALGVTDIDDVMLNTLGGLLGVLFYYTLRLLVKDDNKIKTIIIGLVFFAVIIYIGLLAYAASQGIRVKLL